MFTTFFADTHNVCISWNCYNTKVSERNWLTHSASGSLKTNSSSTGSITATNVWDCSSPIWITYTSSMHSNNSSSNSSRLHNSRRHNSSLACYHLLSSNQLAVKPPVCHLQDFSNNTISLDRCHYNLRQGYCKWIKNRCNRYHRIALIQSENWVLYLARSTVWVG